VLPFVVNNKDYQKGGCLDTPLDPPLYIIDSTLPATADCSVILMVAQSSGVLSIVVGKAVVGGGIDCGN